MDTDLNCSRKWVVENAKLQIKHYQELIERTESEIRESEWMNSKDRIEITSNHLNEKLTISCNHRSWKDVRDDQNAYSRLFFLGISTSYEETIGLTLEQAKQLRDYINQKIEYLES